MLNAINLSQKFDYPLFDNINLTLNPQEKVAIIGSSGSGKSTLLNILSSFLTPDSGKVKILDKDIYKLSEKELIELRRETIGIVFQAHYLFKGFSAKENLDISTILANQAIDYELLKKFNIEKILNQQIGELSGGEQQRLSIARVLTKKPKIIFADEPTGNLDKDTSNDVMDGMFDYVKENNSAMLLVTHDNDLANKCDKVYELKDLKLTLL
jgi:putative ABC transport system ATP-binding protein